MRRKQTRSFTCGCELEVVVRLLLVSGDVEVNPGPGDRQSDQQSQDVWVNVITEWGSIPDILILLTKNLV